MYKFFNVLDYFLVRTYYFLVRLHDIDYDNKKKKKNKSIL